MSAQLRGLFESAAFWASILAEAAAMWWAEVHHAWTYETWPA